MESQAQAPQRSDPSGRHLLEVRDIHLSFKGLKAIDGVSFYVDEGELFAIIGPNGAGKTSIFNCLNQVYRPQQGEILWKGESLLGIKPNQTAEMGLARTFQNIALFPHMTVIENVTLGPRQVRKKPKAEAEDEAMRLLELVKIPEQAHKYPGQLSGGQQQRVAIARALIHSPSVVLADEPTASLDTERANQVVGIFADLIHEEDRAGIMVTHDLRMMKYVDKVIQMVDGKIARVIADRADIDLLAGTSEFDRLDQQEPVGKPERVLQAAPVRYSPSPMYAGAD